MIGLNTYRCAARSFKKSVWDVVLAQEAWGSTQNGHY